MCGIFGILSKNKLDKINLSTSEIALNSLIHRGPDSNDKFISENALLVHTRLSIIEIEKNIQPVKSEDGRYILIFNGQIFNYKEINQKLISLGYEIKNNGDAETLLKAYVHWGENVCDYLNGMFAFAVYDTLKKSLFLARDRFGIKPLYYCIQSENIAFSSEIKTFYDTQFKTFEPETSFFDEFLIWGYVAGSQTLHKDIFEIPQASWMKWESGKIEIKRYWYPVSPSINLNDFSEKKLIDTLEEKIFDAIRYWVKSDVPLSSLLSGGVDSGLITTLASKFDNHILAYTAYSPDQSEVDERHLARKIINNLFKNHSNYREVEFNSNDFEEIINDTIKYLDEPAHASNTNTLMKICEIISKDNLSKVVLCGEGSDEIFGGYKRYRTIANDYKKNNFDQDTLVYAYNKVALPRINLLKDKAFIPNKARWEIEENCKSKEPTTRALELDQLTFICPYLHRQDHIAMKYSLEMRTPFLDHNLVEFVNAIPDKYKIRKDNNGHFWHKYILRKVAERHLDKEIVWNKKKYQFTAPNSESLNGGELYKLLKKQMKKMLIGEFYRTSGIDQLLENHKPGMTYGDHSDNSNTLYRLINLESWLRINTNS